MNPTSQPNTQTPSFGFNDPLNPPQSTTAQSTTQPTTSVQPTQSKDSGNFWSTVGGIALPVLGALLAPETGGASLLASTALSGLGGVAGKAADNAAAGQDPLQANDLTAGITNAAGNLIGGGIAKGVGALFPKVAKVAAGGADSLLMGQAPKGMIDQATANTLRNNFGITNLSKAVPTIDALTGTNGALNQGVIRGLQEAAENGTVSDLSNLNPVAKNLVSQYQTQLKPSSIEQINRVLTGSHINAVNPEDITSIPIKGGGIMNIPDNGALKNVLPQDALNVTRNFETLATQARNSAYDKMGNVIDTDQLAKYKIFSGLAKEAESQSFGGVNPIPLSTVNKAQIVQELAPLQSVNPQAYQHIMSSLDGTQSLNDLRSLQSPLVQASKALNASKIVANKSGGKGLTDILPMGIGAGGFSIGGPAGGLGGFALGKALESNAAQAGGTSILSKLSNVIGSDKAGKVIDTLGRIGGVTAANLPGMGAQPVNSSPSTPSTLPASTGDSSMNPQPSQLNQLLQAMQAQSILAPDLNPNATTLLSSFAPQLQKNALLKNAIGALSGELNNAGGAQGMGGIGSVLSSFVPGTAANAYQGDVNSIAAQLAATLGISVDAAKNLLPGLLQNEQTAGQRQSVLGGMVGNLPS